MEDKVGNFGYMAAKSGDFAERDHGCTLNGSGKLPDDNACTNYTAANQDSYSCEDVLNP